MMDEILERKLWNENNKLMIALETERIKKSYSMINWKIFGKPIYKFSWNQTRIKKWWLLILKLWRNKNEEMIESNENENKV